MSVNEISSKVKAVLAEIKEALLQFRKTGQTWTIFIDKMALTFEERKQIRDFLGIGSVTVKLKDKDEPVEWLESSIAGIWYGVFYNATGKPILETIEISAFPELAAAQSEDIDLGISCLEEKFTSITQEA